MLKKTVAITGALLACSAAAAVRAGHVDHQEVVINVESDYAYGSVIGARNSTDSTQYIYCEVKAIGVLADGDDTPFVWCYAGDAEGASRVCITAEPGLVSVASTITDSSWINFSWRDGGDGWLQICNGITVRNGSPYAS